MAPHPPRRGAHLAIGVDHRPQLERGLGVDQGVVDADRGAVADALGDDTLAEGHRLPHLVDGPDPERNVVPDHCGTVAGLEQGEDHRRPAADQQSAVGDGDRRLSLAAVPALPRQPRRQQRLRMAHAVLDQQVPRAHSPTLSMANQ